MSSNSSAALAQVPMKVTPCLLDASQQVRTMLDAVAEHSLLRSHGTMQWHCPLPPYIYRLGDERDTACPLRLQLVMLVSLILVYMSLKGLPPPCALIYDVRFC